MYEGPSGLTGRPKQVEHYEEVVLEDKVIIYIEKELFKTYLKDNKITIGLEGYGRFILEISSDFDAELQKIVKFSCKEDGDNVGLDRKTFELIAIGASVAANCKASLEYHYETACKVGAAPSEIFGAIKTGEMIREKPKQHLSDVINKIIEETKSSQ